MAVMGPTQQRTTAALAGSMVRLARAKRGLSPAELAARAGMPQSTISRIESGQRQPTLPTLVRILAAADLEMRAWLEDYDDHDDVLDARRAEMTPAQRALLDEQVERADALFAAAAQKPREQVEQPAADQDQGHDRGQD